MRLRRVTAVAVLILLAFATAAKAQLSAEVDEGQGLADSVRSGDRECADLSTDDFEAIGRVRDGSVRR